MRRPGRIMFSAGEASGDRLGAGLAEVLRQRRPDIELFGMGGDRMQRAGVRLIQDAHEIAVVGIFEVLSHLPQLRAAMRRMEQSLRGDRPDLVIPVAFPDFNLRLARRAAPRTGARDPGWVGTRSRTAAGCPLPASQASRA